MMKTVALSLLIISSLCITISAQQSQCGNSMICHEFYPSMEDFLSKRAVVNALSDQWISENLPVNDLGLKTITIVIHVLFRDSKDHISDDQIYSGIEVLNEDFRRLNADFSNTPIEFQAISADCEIEFCLASQDEYGNPTSGITKTQVSDTFDLFSSYYSNELGGKSPWDNLRHLNIWIADLSSVGEGIGGFAQPPSAVGAAFDGVVVDYRYWGRIEKANNPPFHLGRTATHEVGHYLNLEHPWGLDYGCQQDDFVDDTPNQFGPVFGCPTLPVYDACTSIGDGLLFSNYMDYTYEDCTTMFTRGQKERMIAALEGPRSLLIEKGPCGQVTSVVERISTLSFDAFPNPADNYLRIALTDKKFTQMTIALYDTHGKQVLETELSTSRQYEIVLPDELQGLHFLSLRARNGQILMSKKIIIR